MALTRACCIACSAGFESVAQDSTDSSCNGEAHLYVVGVDAVRGDSALQAVSFVDEFLLARVCAFEFFRDGFELDVEFEDGAHVGESLHAHERELGLQVGLFPARARGSVLSRSL
jgi:hypothetical protein